MNNSRTLTASSSLTPRDDPPSYSPSTSSQVLPSSPSLSSSPVSSILETSLGSTSNQSLPDAIAPIFPLGDPLRNPCGQDSRHLPHLISSALSMNLTKPKASLCLAETLVFIRPPGRGWANALAQVNSDDSVPGRDGKVNGFLNIVAPQRKLVKAIKVELVGMQRLRIEKSGWEDEKIFDRVLLLDGDGQGIWLEKGVNTIEYNFHIPSTSPVTERSAHGRIQYFVEGTVVGSGGMFTKDLSDSREVIIVSSPSQADGNIYQFQHHQEDISPTLGPYKIGLTASQFIIGGPLTLSLTFGSNQVSVYAINCYIQQTTTVTSRKNPSQVQEIIGPKRYIFQEGAKSGYGLKGFVAKARDEGNVLIDAEKDKGSFWEWKRMGRLPTDDHIRSTTLPATDTGLRFSSTLTFEVVLNDSSDPVVRIATLYKQEISLASCCCMLPYLALPSYSADFPVNKRIKWDVQTCVGCMCDEVWDRIRDAELELMQNGLGELGVEGIRANRLGGLVDWENGGQSPGLMTSTDGSNRLEVTTATEGDSDQAAVSPRQESGKKIGETYPVIDRSIEKDTNFPKTACLRKSPMSTS
ncbi:Immunoglobulin E-set [Phaffia rhodozyma]|uniref:Immunoglobulin E-set n=1 Tax=Phaffia rhodozyma TaxID=264483 RepID=A0A0F7SJU9_PHARH|nr:Immunoglobulin E-set [Phaffia rhodozyma]